MPETPKLKSILDHIIQNSPIQADLTNEDHARQVFNAAEQLLDLKISLNEIDEIESELIARNEESLVFVLMILKIVRSRLLVQMHNDPLRISVVFAVYKEHNRIRKNSEHPHGENFLVKKVEQLQWLFRDKDNYKWQLTVVDDGCPEDSGKIAQEIIQKENLGDSVQVLFLADAIAEGLAPVRSIKSTSDSQKGGSIAYGMWEAVQQYGEKNHIVVFTDADLSTHLGQLGLLIHPILGAGKLAAIGSRREIDSVVIKKGTRNSRGKLFIYLWKRLIPNLGEIADTQCGFKAFKAEIIPDITDNLVETKFAFDIELLLRTALLDPAGISKVGIAWIDSEEASTTTEIRPYLPMLKSIVKMYRKYFVIDTETEKFASFIDELNEEDFLQLLEHIPGEILEREPYEFTEFDGVSVGQLESCLDQ